MVSSNGGKRVTDLEVTVTGAIPTYPDLAGKVAVVTGSSRGIGAATCRLLAANGVRVVVNGRDAAAVDAAVERIRGDGGEALGVVGDATNSAALAALRRRTEDTFGPVDILGAFIGAGGQPSPITEVTESEWRATIDSNLTATFLAIQCFLPSMLERRRGVIITMASTAGRLPGGAAVAYAAAKAGVVMLTRHVAKEVGPQGVRLNCIAPSAIVTEDHPLRRASEEQRQRVAAGFPLGRLGLPDDVALAALFLASDSSSWITGITLDVAGGRVSI
jgi:3-oxoacyl-[acyl-carrier protein] reductase